MGLDFVRTGMLRCGLVSALVLSLVIALGRVSAEPRLQTSIYYVYKMECVCVCLSVCLSVCSRLTL
jgi:hypothetical protein